MDDGEQAELSDATGGVTARPDFDAYRTFFEQSGVPSLLLDLRRRQVVEVNRAMERFLGLTAEAIVGRPGPDFLEEPTHDDVLRARALRGQSTEVVRYVRTARGPRTAEIVVVPVGDVAFVQAIDLTDVIEANDALEHQSRSLEKSSAMLQTVASRIAHDLRGPLTAITGYVDLLMDDEDDEDKLQMLDRVRSNGTKLAHMVDRVLGEARTGSEGADGSRPSADDHSVARLFAAVRRALDVQLGGDPGAPAPTLSTVSTVATLPVPAAAIEQAVVNLVGNSLGHADPGRPPQIVLAVSAQPGLVIVEVTDNGRGLPEDPEPLFAAGVRGDVADGPEGSGLGLAFARQAVEDLGGRLTARPELEGATFRIELPMAEPPSGAPAPPSPAGGSVARGLSARQLDHIIQRWPSPIVFVDLGTRRILRANQAACETFGVSAEELVGRPDDALFVDPADIDSLRARALAASTAGHFRQEVSIRGRDGLSPTTVSLTTFDNTTLAALTVTAPDADR